MPTVWSDGRAFTLPDNPNVGDTVVIGNRIWTWNGTQWVVTPVGNQTPWLSNIDGANFNLGNVQRIGIGTTTPAAAVDIRAVGVDPALQLVNSDPARNNATIYFRGRQANALLWYMGADPLNNGGQDFAIGRPGIGDPIYIQRTTGNVGIGAATPNYKLTVVGDLQDPVLASGVTTGFVGLISGSAISLQIGAYLSAAIRGNPWIQVSNVATGTAFPLVINPLGGNVGIGNDGTPPFSVPGFVHLTVGPITPGTWGIVTACGYTTNPGSPVGSFAFANYSLASEKRVAEIRGDTGVTTDSGVLRFNLWTGGGSSSILMTIDANGVGIGQPAPSPQATLHVGGASPTSILGGNYIDPSASLDLMTWTVQIDQGGNQLIFRAKYNDGGVRTGAIPLA